jgi:hypothetical protein
MSVHSCRHVLVSDESTSTGRGNTSPTTQAHGHADLAQNKCFAGLRTPGADRSLEGTGKIPIGKETNTSAYNIRELAGDLREVAVNLGDEIGSAIKAIFRRPAIGVAAAGIGLAAVPGAHCKNYGATIIQDMTRAQMTADNRALAGFAASASGFISGVGQNPFNLTLTYFGPNAQGQAVFLAAGHEAQNGITVGSVYLGSDYINNPGAPIPIQSITISTSSDLLAITTSVTASSLDISRDPSSKLVGILVGGDSSSVSIYNNLSAQANLDFLNQFTGLHITEAQVAAGQSIIGLPSSSYTIESRGFGAWSSGSGALNSPDGLSGLWDNSYLPDGAGLFGDHTDPSLYFGASPSSDSYGGFARQIDSGAPGVITVPEPTSVALLAMGLLCAVGVRKRRDIGVAAAGIGLAAVPGGQSESKAALMLDGTTRAMMTADNPALDGFFASATASISGIPLPNNLTLTHLWGPYYAAGAHEVQSAFSLGNIYLGRDYYRNNPGNPIGINSIDVSPYSDLAVITAATADTSLRDPNTHLVGIAVARQGAQLGSDSGTIYNLFSSPLNLSFINQITGSNITEEDILAGKGIFAVPEVGQHVWSSGFGAWGTLSTGLSNPDGLAGQWQSVIDASAPTFENSTDPNFYVVGDFQSDGRFGTLNGFGESIDSGSPGVISINVPEPTSATGLALGLTGLLALRTQRRRKGDRNGSVSILGFRSCGKWSWWFIGWAENGDGRKRRRTEFPACIT